MGFLTEAHANREKSSEEEEGEKSQRQEYLLVLKVHLTDILLQLWG